MKTTITALAAVAVLAAGAASAERQGVDALLEEYAKAEEVWKQKVREADSGARRELRKNPPAAAFWERFATAAEAGEGRALFWMATHLRAKGLKSSEVREQKPGLYGRLFELHVGEAWFGEVLAELRREKRYFDDGQLAGFFEAAAAKNEHAEVRAQAMYRLGLLLLDADEPAEREAGRAWLEKAAALADTEYGTMARAELYKPVIGEAAPDFQARTIDGFEFKLSDYRGKVVLLDFYGFW